MAERTAAAEVRHEQASERASERQQALKSGKSEGAHTTLTGHVICSKPSQALIRGAEPLCHVHTCTCMPVSSVL